MLFTLRLTYFLQLLLQYICIIYHDRNLVSRYYMKSVELEINFQLFVMAPIMSLACDWLTYTNLKVHYAFSTDDRYVGYFIGYIVVRGLRTAFPRKSYLKNVKFGENCG